MTNDQIIKRLSKYGFFPIRKTNSKILHLDIFLKTKEFYKIQDENKYQSSLLSNQFSFMQSYKETLVERIANLKNHR